MHRFRDFFAAGMLAFVALVVRAYNFRHGEPPSFPEIVASLDAFLPFLEYLRTPQIDLCPPLYYAILKLLTPLGGPLWMMRLPSLIVGALTPALLYLLLRDYGGRLAMFVAGLILATAPVHVFFSQQAEPVVFTSCLVLVVFTHFLSMKTDNSARQWFLYDLSLVMVMLLHRDATFVAIAFFLLHWARHRWLQRVARASSIWLGPVHVIVFNHLLVAAASTPWLAIMPTKTAWLELRPTWSDPLKVLLIYPLLGAGVEVSRGWLVAVTVFYLALCPAGAHFLRRRGGVLKSALLASVLFVVLPFVASLEGRPRFNPQALAAIAMPISAVVLGTLIAHSRLLVRWLVLGFCVSAMLYGVIHQADVRDNPPYAAVANSIEKNVPAGSVVVTWPDFADRMSAYFLGDRYQIVSASEFFEKWAEPPRDRSVAFAVYQFPWKEAHPYTFYAALAQFSDARILFRERLNLAAESHRLNMLGLRLWYDDPDTLNIVDQPSTDTLFLFHPGDQAFQGPEFLHDLPGLAYESSGRKCVWLVREHATIPLKVSLGPGRYNLRLHASPDFECPDTGQRMERRVTVGMRVGEQQVRTTLHEEGFVELALEVEAELRTIDVLLAVDRLDWVSCPRPLPIGLKIYSLAIDHLVTPEESR